MRFPHWPQQGVGLKECVNVSFVKKEIISLERKILYKNFRIIQLQVERYATNDSSIMVFVSQDILKYMAK